MYLEDEINSAYERFARRKHVARVAIVNGVCAQLAQIVRSCYREWRKQNARARDVAKVRNVNRGVKKKKNSGTSGPSCERVCDTATQAQGSFTETGATTSHNLSLSLSLALAVLHLTVGQLPPKNVSLSAWHIRHSAGEARGQTRATDRASPRLLSTSTLAQATLVEREDSAQPGPCRRRCEPGADVATASGGTDPAATAPSRDPLAERLKTPRRAPEEPDRALTARSSHRNSPASVSSCVLSCCSHFRAQLLQSSWKSPCPPPSSA